MKEEETKADWHIVSIGKSKSSKSGGDAKTEQKTIPPWISSLKGFGWENFYQFDLQGNISLGVYHGFQNSPDWSDSERAQILLHYKSIKSGKQTYIQDEFIYALAILGEKSKLEKLAKKFPSNICLQNYKILIDLIHKSKKPIPENSIPESRLGQLYRLIRLKDDSMKNILYDQVLIHEEINLYRFILKLFLNARKSPRVPEVFLERLLPYISSMSVSDKELYIQEYILKMPPSKSIQMLKQNFDKNTFKKYFESIMKNDGRGIHSPFAEKTKMSFQIRHLMSIQFLSFLSPLDLIDSATSIFVNHNELFQLIEKEYTHNPGSYTKRRSMGVIRFLEGNHKEASILLKFCGRYSNSSEVKLILNEIYKSQNNGTDNLELLNQVDSSLQTLAQERIEKYKRKFIYES
jgi:hypothetical protein